MQILSQPSLVLLHGHAGSAHTFRNLAEQLGPERVTLPQSPLFAEVRAWWSHDDFGPTICNIKELELPSGPIVIGGFSQGASMAAAVAACTEQVVGLICVAGFLPEPVPELLRPLPALLLHSSEDETVDPFLGTRLARWAVSAGCSVTQHEYLGGHRWTDRVDELVVEWFLNFTLASEKLSFDA